jgi:uncharacterized protein (DUF3820 family)
MEVEERKEIQGIVGFGKFAMSKWKDLPKEYLEFIASNECYTSNVNKEKAKLELNERKKVPGQLNFGF